MALTGTYEPSPTEFVREQVATYEATDGREGNTMRGKPVIILTTVGARSGNLRKTPLMRVEHDGHYLVVASKGGAPDNPEWYTNIRANPVVELQDGATKKEYDTRELSGAEREPWWERAVAAWPDYAAYQEKTDREIPLIELVPRG